MHCLPIFLDRLKNEITRLTAVKALISIAKSDLKIELKPILAESMPILAGFLRKNQRALKMSSLTLLDTVVKNYSTQITDKNLEPVRTFFKITENLFYTSLNYLPITQITAIFKSAFAIIRHFPRTNLPS